MPNEQREVRPDIQQEPFVGIDHWLVRAMAQATAQEASVNPALERRDLARLAAQRVYRRYFQDSRLRAGIRDLDGIQVPPQERDFFKNMQYYLQNQVLFSYALAALNHPSSVPWFKDVVRAKGLGGIFQQAKAADKKTQDLRTKLQQGKVPWEQRDKCFREEREAARACAQLLGQLVMRLHYTDLPEDLR